MKASSGVLTARGLAGTFSRPTGEDPAQVVTQPGAIRLVLRGDAGSIVWGYRDAARLRAWIVRHHSPDKDHDGRWTLTATIDRVDRYVIRKRPLLFTAPRSAELGGYWLWPMHTESIQVGDVKVLELSPTVTVIGARITATLGPPER